MQAEQLEAKWSGELELKLIEQENHYHRELALVLSQLRGIEYMINTISAAGVCYYCGIYAVNVYIFCHLLYIL